MAPQPPQFDAWTVRSLIASALAMILAAVVMFLPAWRISWILVVGALVFVLMLLHHPAHWHRRMAATMITAAVVLATPPMFKAHGEIANVGWFSLVMDGSPWVSLALVVGAVIIIFRELQPSPAPLPDAQADETRPASKAPGPDVASQLPDPAEPRPRPNFTGVVEARVDGRVWRARMHTGEAIDAKPFCPRHGVPLKARSDDTSQWHCTHAKCDYYQYLPNLSMFANDKVKFLKHVYGEIERRVREGEGYVVCPDNDAAHI